jgi:hypothetical protein
MLGIVLGLLVVAACAIERWRMRRSWRREDERAYMRRWRGEPPGDGPEGDH